jgi:hypothetical protein
MGRYHVPSQEATDHRSSRRALHARRGTPRTRPRVSGDPVHFYYPSAAGLAGLDEAGADTALQSQLEAWIFAPIFGPKNHRPSRRSERCDDKILCELRHPVCGGRPSKRLIFLKTIRPAYANHELRPSRRLKANVRLPELYAKMTKVLVRETLSEWAEFSKAALLVDGWESTSHELLTFLPSLPTKCTFWRVSRPDPTGKVRQIKLRLCNASSSSTLVYSMLLFGRYDVLPSDA